MMRTEALSEREQQALEQMLEAQRQGSTLKAYAAKMGLDVGQLYDLRRRLVRKGAFGALPRPKARKSRKASAFAPSLADKDRIAEEVAREWQQVRLRERMEWLYNYDATAIAI